MFPIAGISILLHATENLGFENSIFKFYFPKTLPFKAREHHYQAENIQNEVVNNMLYHTQKDRTLDLHFMTVDKALLALRTKLKFMKSMG